VNQPPSDTFKSRRAYRWGLARGESVVASLGVAVGIVIVGVLAASSWWTLHTYRQSLERGRLQQVQTVAEYLALQSTELLGHGEAGMAKSLLAKAALQSDLQVCRVVLPDGKVIADADAKAQQLPSGIKITPALRASKAEGQESMIVDSVRNTIKIKVPISPLSYGPCTLEVFAAVQYPLLAGADVQIGIGAIGILGMGGLLIAYRLMRRRLRGLGAIADALRCVAMGETSSGALHISESFGDEARAWNMLLSQRDKLRDQAVLEQATEKLQSRAGQGGGDLGAACDALWSGLAILDVSGSIRYANGAASVLLCRKRDELVGAAMAAVLENPAAAEAIAAVASGKTRQRTSIEIERKGNTAENGDRTVIRLTARPLRREENPNGTATAIVLIEDVTQQRVADESRNAFVAQATHELRTPLTNIRLYVETMVEDGENDASVRSKCINVIGQEAKRLERIVADMLSVSEIEAGSLKLHSGEVRLDALFEELEADFKAQAEDKEIKLAFELPPKYPLCNGDRDKILLALNNLIGNALKYTPAGGAVSVRVEAGPSTGNNLVVDVVDNGIGIAPEEQELIFEKFYRAKDRRIAGITGSGIGLALARQVARLHRGEISVKSQLDKGSTFTLTLPLSAAPKAAVAQAA
jgi:signal transduction histidine kinase